MSDTIPSWYCFLRRKQDQAGKGAEKVPATKSGQDTEATCLASPDLVAGTFSFEHVLREFRQLVELIESPPLSHRICRDADDDQLLALAQTANVDMLVSGDNDLLQIGSFAGIPIVTPADALMRLSP